MFLICFHMVTICFMNLWKAYRTDCQSMSKVSKNVETYLSLRFEFWSFRELVMSRMQSVAILFTSFLYFYWVFWRSIESSLGALWSQRLLERIFLKKVQGEIKKYSLPPKNANGFFGGALVLTPAHISLTCQLNWQIESGSTRCFDSIVSVLYRSSNMI